MLFQRKFVVEMTTLMEFLMNNLELSTDIQLNQLCHVEGNFLNLLILHLVFLFYIYSYQLT
jgi:hypothetical protein